MALCAGDHGSCNPKHLDSLWLKEGCSNLSLAVSQNLAYRLPGNARLDLVSSGCRSNAVGKSLDDKRPKEMWTLQAKDNWYARL